MSGPIKQGVRPDGTGRVRAKSFVAGEGEVSGPAVRDMFVVKRTISAGPTNCHGFADDTVLINPSDERKYGAVDVTVSAEGPGDWNHVYAMQDRVTWRGSGVLANSKGFISQTVHAGTGDIDLRIGVEVNEMVKISTGNINSQIGVMINKITTGENNVALNIQQEFGRAVYIPNGAPSFSKGAVGLGQEASAGIKLDVDGETGDGSTAALRLRKVGGYALVQEGTAKIKFTGPVGCGVDPDSAIAPLLVQGAGGGIAFLSTNAGTAAFGAIGDTEVSLVSDGAVRLAVDATTRAVRPGDDNTQSAGTAAKRFSVFFAGTGAINTSDERTKTLKGEMSEAVLRAWSKVNFCQYKFIDAVEEKGDGARWHFGVLAQQVKAAFESEGLNAFDYGVLCYDEWPERVVHHEAVYKEAEYSAILDADGRAFVTVPPNTVVVTEAYDEVTQVAGNRYGIRYEEALILECAYLRSLVVS